MSEMALTADHLLVIGRGRMIADLPLPELMARHSGERVEVRSAAPRPSTGLVATPVVTGAGSGGHRRREG